MQCRQCGWRFPKTARITGQSPPTLPRMGSLWAVLRQTRANYSTRWRRHASRAELRARVCVRQRRAFLNAERGGGHEQTHKNNTILSNDSSCTSITMTAVKSSSNKIQIIFFLPSCWESYFAAKTVRYNTKSSYEVN